MFDAEPQLRRLDERFIELTRRHGGQILRWSLGVVFLWFGALKMAGVSPVADLVGTTVPWIPQDVFVPALGVCEVLIGLGLIIGRFPRIVLGLFWLQMAGTFLTFLIQPGVMFADRNPFLLTVEGEFVVKNIVLIAAGLALAGSVRRETESGATRLGRGLVPTE